MIITLNKEQVTPLVEEVVSAVMDRLRQDEELVGDRFAYTEEEAADLLGLRKHQLRDERLRGRIGASKIVGDGIRYTREDLLDYLQRRRFEPKQL